MEADLYDAVMRETLRRIVRETLARIAETARLDELVQEAVAPPAGIGRPERAGLVRQPLLTAREQQILGRIAAGHSNKMIARELDLSLHTIKRHVANILNKLGVSSRFQAATWLHARASARIPLDAVA